MTFWKLLERAVKGRDVKRLLASKVSSWYNNGSRGTLLKHFATRRGESCNKKTPSTSDGQS